MPKRKQPKRIKRRDKRPRGVADWSGQAARHGPFGIFSNVKLFYVIGAIIMMGSVAGGGLGVCVASNSPQPTPTPAATEQTTATPEPGATPGATGTPLAI